MAGDRDRGAGARATPSSGLLGAMDRPIDLVSDATTGLVSEVEKENTLRGGLATGVGVKRRRVPGVHHDLVVDDAAGDGYNLSQVDEDTGEVRPNLVSWKSVSPPRFRSGLNPGHNQQVSTGGSSKNAGGAVVHQLLRIGRGSAAAMQHAKQREDTRRRVCERLDTWEDENANTAAASGSASLGSLLPAEANSNRGGGDKNTNDAHAERSKALCLLADVQAMQWAFDAAAGGTPASVGRPSVGAPTQKTPNSTGRGSLDNQGVGGVTPVFDVNGRGTSPSVAILPVLVPLTGLPIAVSAPIAETAAAGASREGEKNVAPTETKTKTKTNETVAHAVQTKTFACDDWGDDFDFDVRDFDLAVATNAAEAEHRKRDVSGNARGASNTNARGVGTGSAGTDAKDGGVTNTLSEFETLKQNETRRQKEREQKETRVEAEGTALGAFRVTKVTRHTNGRLDLLVRRCGDSRSLSTSCDPYGVSTGRCDANDKSTQNTSRETLIRLHDAWSDTCVLVGDTCLVTTPFNAQRIQSQPDPPCSSSTPVDGKSPETDTQNQIPNVIDITMDSDSLFVMHPGVLINATAVGGSMQCLRRSVLQTQVPDNAGGDGGQAAMLGTLSHDLCEGSLISTAFNTGPGAVGFFKHAERIVADNVGRIFGAGVGEREALERLRYVGPGVHKWSRALVRRGGALPAGAPLPSPPPGITCEVLDGPGKRSVGNVVLTKMIDAEETVWAPKLGLRGVVDAVAVGKLETRPAVGVDGTGKPNVATGITPVELKTGYWRSPVEHGAQLSLYTLMLSERYKQRVPFGLLHYTRHPGGQGGSGLRNKKDDETVAIRPGKRDIAFLMLRRNLLASALNPYRGGLLGLQTEDAVNDDSQRRLNESQKVNPTAKDFGVPFALGTLPPMEQCATECERCFVKRTCFTVNAALEGGGDKMADKAVAGLARETVGHLTPKLAECLKKWLNLVDLEASVSSSRRATPWMPVSDVRNRGAFAVGGLRFLPSTKHGHKTKLGEKFNCAEDDDEFAGDTTDSSLAANAPRPYLYALAVPTAETRETHEIESESEHESELLHTLRPGDRLVLSRNHGEIVVGRVIVVDVGARDQKRFVRLASERAVRFDGPGAAKDDQTWRLDKDDGGGTMSGRARAALVETFSSGDARAVNLRRQLFDLAPPVFDYAQADTLLANLSLTGAKHVWNLNDEQRGAVRRVLAAKDYCLIVGLPGSGKSQVLAATVRALLDSGKSVLITSHTHTAVDNVLQRLPNVGVDSFVRLGGEHGKASVFAAAFTPGGPKHNAQSTTELQNLADSCSVVGATCYAAANHPIITRRRAKTTKASGSPDLGNIEETHNGFFDVVLVDEAGQMTLPSSLPPLLRAGVFVLVGDPHQLPPLVQSEAASAGGLSVSPMQLLSETHPSCVAELCTQYRMADDLARISNLISYGGRLRAANDFVANRVLTLTTPAPSQTPAWLVRATDPLNRVVFLDTSDFGRDAYETNGGGGSETHEKSADGKQMNKKNSRGNKHVNRLERDVILKVLRVLHSRGADVGSCAVLSPYNSQVDALALDLQKSASAIPQNTEALTIDRAQGRDVDCVLISFVRGNLGKECGRLLADRRRLNVALTRAKCKLVLVGCGETLLQSPVLSQVLGIMLEEGWIVPMQPGSV